MAQAVKQINISRLPPERKRKAWQWLKNNRPEQARLIESEMVQALIKTFDGEVIIDVETGTDEAS